MVTKRRRIKQVFTKKDYNSNYGMRTTTWGPIFWSMLHFISFNYPVNPSEEDKQYYKSFVLSLKYVLPCGKCRENLKLNFEKHPLRDKDMSSRTSFSRYIYKLHNVVNKMLKKDDSLSYDEIRERYEYFRAKCPKITDNKETGCTESIYNFPKSRCIINYVPETEEKGDSIVIDEKCLIGGK